MWLFFAALKAVALAAGAVAETFTDESDRIDDKRSGGPAGDKAPLAPPTCKEWPDWLD